MVTKKEEEEEKEVMRLGKKPQGMDLLTTILLLLCSERSSFSKQIKFSL